MRKTVVFLVLLLLVISSVPPASAQFEHLVTRDEITVVRGDYATGELSLKNEGGYTYKVVSLQKFWVEDSGGRVVEGFRFEAFPRVFGNWNPGRVYSMSYNLTCPSNVSGGNYTLYLRFWAVTGDNTMYILVTKVPLHVIPEPLVFRAAEAYVPSRPGSSYVLNGERIVVVSHVINLGHFPIRALGSVSLIGKGRAYFHEDRNLTFIPGDNLVRFEVPVGYDLPEGVYRVDYRIRYSDGEYTYSRDFQVKFGVTLVGVSLKSEEVKINEENTAYLTLLSERVIDLNLTVRAYRNGTLVSKTVEPVHITGGTNVIEVRLPTNVSGNITAVLGLTYGNRVVGEGRVTYRVLAPPILKGVSYERTGDNEVTFRVLIENPADVPVEGVLSYRISTDEGVLYRDSVKQSIPPGISEVTVKFQVLAGKTIYYEFSLLAEGESSSISGHLYVEPPAPPTTTGSTTTTPSTTSTPETTTTAGGSGSRGHWMVLVLAVFLILAVGAWYYLREQRKTRKKRVRPKPKRRSPLGRFRRPRRPHFRERGELPRK